MYTILAFALLTNQYDMIGDPVSPQSLVMIGCMPPIPLVEEEEDDQTAEVPCQKPDGKAVDPNLVVVYLDFDDDKMVQRLSKDRDQIEGLRISFRDSDRIPAEGRRYLSTNSGAKLPLLQYHTDSGWKFSAGWPGAFNFAQRWVAGNSGKELQAHNQDVSVRQSQRGNQNSSVGYPIRGSWWTGCGSWHHLTQGQHAGKFDQNWLRGLSNSEIQSLHSDDHEGRVNWNYARRPDQTSSVPQSMETAPTPKAKKRRVATGFFSTRGVYCPSGNCPWSKG